MYQMRFDRVDRVLYLTLTGFWTMATVARFAGELLVRATALRVRHGRFAVLSDAIRFPLQSAEVSARFERIMARGLEMNVGPSAIVVASHLNKLQAERVLRSDRVRVFLDHAEAAAWLAAVWNGGAGTGR